MSRVIVIVLSLVVLSQSFQKTWIIASWTVNRDYIAANLCENRMVKESTCSGSCYLNKQLKEQDQKEQRLPASERDKFDFMSDLFFYSIAVVSHQYTQATSFPISWEQGKPYHIGFSIFHPPSLLG